MPLHVLYAVFSVKVNIGLAYELILITQFPTLASLGSGCGLGRPSLEEDVLKVTVSVFLS